MTTGRPSIGELDLLAYVDGQLEPQRRAEVEAYLALNPEEAAWVRDCLAQNDLIRELHGGAFHEPVPQALAAAFGARPVRAASSLRRIAAALVLFLGGGVAGWWIGAPDGTGGDGFVREMAAAHVEARSGAGQPGLKLVTDAGLPLLADFVTDGAPLEAPDLAEHGLAPVGRREVPGPDGRPAVQLIYEDLGGRRLSLYLKPHRPKGQAEFDVTAEGGLAVARWPADPLIYGLASDLPEEEVAEIARTVDRALHAVGGAAPAPVVADGHGGDPVLAPVVVPLSPTIGEDGEGGAADM